MGAEHQNRAGSWYNKLMRTQGSEGRTPSPTEVNTRRAILTPHKRFRSSQRPPTTALPRRGISETLVTRRQFSKGLALTATAVTLGTGLGIKQLLDSVPPTIATASPAEVRATELAHLGETLTFSAFLYKNYSPESRREMEARSEDAIWSFQHPRGRLFEAALSLVGKKEDPKKAIEKSLSWEPFIRGVVNNYAGVLGMDINNKRELENLVKTLVCIEYIESKGDKDAGLDKIQAIDSNPKLSQEQKEVLKKQVDQGLFQVTGEVAEDFLKNHALGLDGSYNPFNQEHATVLAAAYWLDLGRQFPDASIRFAAWHQGPGVTANITYVFMKMNAERFGLTPEQVEVRFNENSPATAEYINNFGLHYSGIAQPEVISQVKINVYNNRKVTLHDSQFTAPFQYMGAGMPFGYITPEAA